MKNSPVRLGLFAVASLIVLANACSDDETTPPKDGGDASTSGDGAAGADATGGQDAAGNTDSATTDSGTSDTGSTDTGTSDSSITDAAPDANDGGPPLGAPVWAKRFGNPGTAEIIWGVAGDATGNVYAAIAAQGAVDFGNSVTLAAGDAGAGVYQAVLKLDANGVAQWVRPTGSKGTAIFGNGVAGIAVDGSGSSYIFGHGQPTQGTAGQPSLYLQKYDTAGVHQWTRQFGGTSTNQDPRAITVDGSGNVYVAGGAFCSSPTDNIVIGTYSRVCGVTGTSGDSFVAKYNSAGVLQWAHAATASFQDFATGVVVDSAGNVTVNGLMQGNITWIGTTANHSSPSSLAQEENYIVRFNAAGNAVAWNKSWGASSPAGARIAQVGSDIVLDMWTHANRVVLGQTAATAAESFVTVNPATGDATAITPWGAHGFGFSGTARLATSPNGRLLRSVRFGGNRRIGPYTPAAIGAFGDVLLAKFDSALGLVSYSQAGVSASFSPKCVGFDGTNAALAGADFQGTLTFGSDTLVNAQDAGSSDDIVILKIAPTP